MTMEISARKNDCKSIGSWDRAKRDGVRRVMITAYDFPFAQMANHAGIDGILVGDSVGMAVQGERDTLRVSLDQMIYHTGMVSRGAPDCLIMADLPFGSFEASPSQAFESAARLVKAGADIVKLEGGAAMAETVAFLSARAIPVCSHIGLTPQHVRQLGGFRKQGKTEDAAAQVLNDATTLAEAGARMVLMEAIPAALGTRITEQVGVPTIGIGAGGSTDVQILVMHDVLGLTSGYVPGFAKTYIDGGRLLREAIGTYAEEVRSGAFPPAG